MQTNSVSTLQHVALSVYQGLNADIYLIVNDRNYDTSHIISRIHRYAIYVLKAARKKKIDRIPYHLSMAFSWSMALANRLHISIEDETWKRFPGVCPYCTKPVCACVERPEERSRIDVPWSVKPGTLIGFQEMFARIYPANTLESSAAHLAEEVGELDQAVEFFAGTHQPAFFDEIVEELVDVVANLCAVATCSNLVLSDEVARVFQNGCPACGQNPCKNCGFTVAKSVPIR